MLSGEELLRNKKGVHNSFESPDSINQLDWTNKTKYPQVFAYYKNLIALRQHHPAFRLGKRISSPLESIIPPSAWVMPTLYASTWSSSTPQQVLWPIA